ncbi:unnamed protein product, partial [Closterium sp. NIES-53]
MQVRGIVQSDDGEEKATLVGRWDQLLHFVPGELSSKSQKEESEVRGIVQSDDGEEKATLVGRWDQFLHFVPGELSSKSQKEESEVLATAQLLWQKCAPSPFPCKYKFTPFCISLNEMTPGLK